MHVMGNSDEAEPLYTSSIRSAHAHKFIHEEGITSELTGDFLYEQGRQSEAYALYMHSIKCYIKWDALAVGMRVEADIERKFESGILSQLQKAANHVDETMKRILDDDSADTNKRPSEEM